MASARSRANLARQARRLNEAAGARLPPLVLMTDARPADWVAAAAALPQGAGMVVRARDGESRAALARRLAPVARARRLVLLIAGDAKLADTVHADGLHLPEARIGETAHWRRIRPDWLLTAAAHSERAVLRAARAGAMAALLAPVFATRSHPDARPLGALRARLIAQRSPLPLYALGGIDALSARRLAASRFAGLAAVGALVP